MPAHVVGNHVVGIYEIEEGDVPPLLGWFARLGPSNMVDMEHTTVWAKAGVMLRETLLPSSTYAAAIVTSGHGVLDMP